MDPQPVLSIGLLCVVARWSSDRRDVFFTVAYGYLPAILTDDRLVAGNQMLELSESGARVAGPSIGGAILQAGGAAAAALDGISYIVSALAIAGLRADPPTTPPLHERTDDSFLDRNGRGARARRDRILRDLAGSTAIFNFGSGMILAVLVVFATHDVGLDAAGFGLVYGLGNLGFILGAGAVRALTDRLG